MSYAGDFDASDVVYLKFTTVNTGGVPTQLAGTPAISIYKDGSTTQSTTGVTLTVDFDSVTGLNHVAIDTSADGTFYSTGSDFIAVITTGTVSGSSVVGYEVGSFSLRNRSALMSTTAGRTLDVASTGEAGLDFNNVLSTSLVTLHSLTVTGATTLSGAVSLGSTLGVTGTTTFAAINTGAVGLTTLATSGTTTLNALTVTNATTLSGAVSLGSTLGVTGTTTFAAINTGAVGVTTLASSGATTFNSLTVTNGTTLSGAVTATHASNDVRGVRLSATGVDDIWDEVLAAHTTADTTGLVLNMLTQDTVTLSTDVALGSIFGQLLDNGTSWSYDRSTDSMEAIRDSAGTAAAVADAVWDESRSGHLAAGTFGQALQLVRSGTAQGAGASTITLDASASSVNDYYNGNVVQIIDGTGAGQTNLIEDYSGTTTEATVRNEWSTTPDATSVFVIHPLSLDLTLLDVAVSTRMPSASSLSTISAISGDDLELLIGVDYKDANGNAVAFAPEPSSWPDLTDSIVTLILQNPTSTSNIEINGTVDVATGTAQEFHFDVPATMTETLPPAYGRYWVKATLTTGDVYPLSSGVLRWRDPLEA